jgi:flagellar biosynthesis GTPase FlhF
MHACTVGKQSLVHRVRFGGRVTNLQSAAAVDNRCKVQSSHAKVRTNHEIKTKRWRKTHNSTTNKNKNKNDNDNDNDNDNEKWKQNEKKRENRKTEPKNTSKQHWQNSGNSSSHPPCGLLGELCSSLRETLRDTGRKLARTARRCRGQRTPATA